MDEKAKETLKLQFDKRLRLEFRGGKNNLGCRAVGLSKGLMQGSERGIDNQMPCIYY